MAKRDELLALYDLADRKGFDVTQSTMRDHVRLIDGDGNLVRNKMNGAAHSYALAEDLTGDPEFYWIKPAEGIGLTGPVSRAAEARAAAALG
jgi:hypothetical protein